MIRRKESFQINNSRGYLSVVHLRSTHSITSYFDETVELKNKLVGAEYFQTAPMTSSGCDLCKN
jgi:hypothetical protein